VIDMKFVLLHEAKNDDGIKAFFTDVWELYVKVSKKEIGSRCADDWLDDDESVPHSPQGDTEPSV
jgi:hypothetical protein